MNMRMILAREENEMLSWQECLHTWNAFWLLSVVCLVWLACAALRVDEREVLIALEDQCITNKERIASTRSVFWYSWIITLDACRKRLKTEVQHNQNNLPQVQIIMLLFHMWNHSHN